MKGWVIWSEEHGAWWGPDSSGYTRALCEAGRYSEAQARAIVRKANAYVMAPLFHEIAMVDPLCDIEVVE